MNILQDFGRLELGHRFVRHRLCNLYNLGRPELGHRLCLCMYVGRHEPVHETVAYSKSQPVLLLIDMIGYYE